MGSASRGALHAPVSSTEVTKLFRATCLGRKHRDEFVSDRSLLLSHPGFADGQWLGYQWDNPEITPLEDCQYYVAEADFTRDKSRKFPSMIKIKSRCSRLTQLRLSVALWRMAPRAVVPDDNQVSVGRPPRSWNGTVRTQNSTDPASVAWA